MEVTVGDATLAAAAKTGSAVTNSTPKITEATMRSGEKVYVNDHVYVASPWDKRDPVPYSIGRIMEFIPPEDVNLQASRREASRVRDLGLRCRIAWFYRPTDVQDKGVGDHRLLLAAMFSEITPFSNVRGKCIVRHRDKIADLNAYKKKEDQFYFYQLFDPFTKDNYEIILAQEVHNLPVDIKDVLISRYEFVVCERDFLPDLQDDLRNCETCGDWCPGLDSVTCELCKKHYHMECVKPPLLTRPSRGYAWSCPECNDTTENQEVEVSGPRVRNSNMQIAAAKARHRARLNAKLDERNDKYWKEWSFRYFGQYTVAEDTLDPDDMIYVRAPTRIGPKFQATVKDKPQGEAKPADDKELPLRGEDATIELMNNVVHMTNEQMAEVDRRKGMLTARTDLQHSVDWLEEVIRRFSEARLEGKTFYSVNMRSPLCTRKWKEEGRYRDKEWSEIEDGIFDEAVRKYHSELRRVRAELLPRTYPEIVRKFGHWKAQQLKIQRLAPMPEVQEAPITDDNASIYQKNDRRSYTCAVCRTRESETWYKAPRNLPTNSMCEDCGMAWRKYAIKSAKGTEKEKEYLARIQTAHATPEPPVTRAGAAGNKNLQVAEKQKRESTPAGPVSKKQKVGVSLPTKLVCSLCRKSGPHGQVIKCTKCGFTVHGGCVGVPLEDASPDWTCEICSNEQTLESNLDTKCILCPPNPVERKKGARDSAFFRAAKPTECRNWAHVLCSVFNHQVEFTDARHMRLVEGIVSIPQRFYSQPCACCRGSDGVVAQCEYCMTTFHPVCAWNHGFRFGIEFQLFKPYQRGQYPPVEWRGETGWMKAEIICDSHPVLPRKAPYDLCDLDERGRTALQVYTEAYKQAHDSDKTYGLLRKARRLDEIINAPHFDALPALDPVAELPLDNQCIFCGTEFSPYWWPPDALPGVNLDNLIRASQEDVKILNSDGSPTNGKGEPDMMEIEESTKENSTPKALHRKICHTCYFTRSQEQKLPIALDINTPIAVV